MYIYEYIYIYVYIYILLYLLYSLDNCHTKLFTLNCHTLSLFPNIEIPRKVVKYHGLTPLLFGEIFDLKNLVEF